MKKLIFILAVTFIAFISCKQSNFEESQGEYGTVVFDLTGGSNLRSIDQSTGLPKLENSKIQLIIERDGERAEVREFGETEKKQYKGTFLVGTKIKFTAIVMTKSGKWKGSSEITVASGINNLDVKLKKAIAELEPLKFKLYRDETVSSNHVQRFSLGFLGEEPFFKDVEVSSVEYEEKAPSFCRDSKGRIYVFYKDNVAVNANIILKRYTSDGKEDDKFSYNSTDNRKTGLSIVSDQKTGRVFVFYKEGSMAEKKLFLVQEGKPAQLKEINISSITDNIHAIGVYNGVFSFLTYGNKYQVSLYRYKENSASPSISKIVEKDIDGELFDIWIDGFFKPIRNVEFADCFMNDKNVYILCSHTSVKGDLYNFSTGGVIKLGYAVQNDTASFEEPKKLMYYENKANGNKLIADSYKFINVKDEKKEFYGPKRFVGFNEDVLYIADDGTVREYETGAAQVLENKNRLVSFNLKSEDISIEKEGIETWMPEEKVIAKTKPTLFFSYSDDSKSATMQLYDGQNWFDFDHGNNTTEKKLTITESHLPIVYEFNSSGSFYVSYLRKVGIDQFDELKKYSPRQTQNGIVYEHSLVELSSDLNANNHITSLHYDSVKKDLYFIASDGSDDSLYRREGNGWKKINRGNYIFKKSMTIYDGKIWSYDNDTRKIESIGIKKDSSELENRENPEFDVPTEFGSKEVFSFSIYDDVVYLLYREAGPNFKQDVYALAMKKDGSKLQKTREPLFKLATDIEDIRPIGFDKETKELKFFYDVVDEDYDGRILDGGINKYISLKYNEDTGFNKTEIDTPSNDIKWYEEKTAWKGAKDTVLWATHSHSEAGYYVVSEKKWSEQPTVPVLEGNGVYSVYDKFCYDQFGNLYVLIKKGSDYYVVRFKLSEEGKYNLKELDDKIGDSSFDNWEAKFHVISSSFEIDDFIMAVYANSSDSGVLYYRIFDNPNEIRIEKHTFTDGEFNAGDDGFWMGVSSDYTPVASSAYPDPLPVKRHFMSMAANKDGVFIAQKELEYVQPNNQKYYKNYNIEVRKYPHDSPDYESPINRVDVVGVGGKLDENNEVKSPWTRVPTDMFNNYTNGGSKPGLKDENAQWDKFIRENITDMCAYNGVLYALSYKRVGGQCFYTEDASSAPKLRKATVSGAIWKVCNTDDASNNAKEVFKIENGDENEKAGFSPRHFIGILPKRLVVASDGYYCYVESETSWGAIKKAINYDGVFFFNLKDDKVEKESEEKDIKASFDFNVEETSANISLDCEWAWNN